MARWHIFAGCLCGMLCGNMVAAMDPPISDAQRAYEAQRAHARELIQKRAASESRARQARMESRKRAGVSLLRPAVPVSGRMR
jgi:hypothetical protein